jgi:hypothetical protein
MLISSRARWILLIGDVLALLLFVAGGQAEHDTANPDNPLLGLLATAIYYVPVWLVSAWLLGALPVGAVSARAFFARTLNAWLVAAPLATLVRALALGRAIIPVPFLLVTLGLGGTFVVAWRLGFAVIGMRRRAPAAPAA